MRTKSPEKGLFVFCEPRDEFATKKARLLVVANSFYGAYYVCMVYYAYVLENQDDKSFYIGFTADLKRRIFEHQSGKGGRTTKNKLKYNLSRGTATKNDIWKLIYFEGYINQKDAIGREKFLKSGSGRKYLKKQLKHYLEIN